MIRRNRIIVASLGGLGLAGVVTIVLQIIEIAERINLLHQAVLAGEILNAGHWGSFLQIGMHVILTMLYCGK